MHACSVSKFFTTFGSMKTGCHLLKGLTVPEGLNVVRTVHHVQITINQHLYTTLCLVHHTLVTATRRFTVYEHDLQGTPSNCQFFVRQVLISTCWPFDMRS